MSELPDWLVPHVWHGLLGEIYPSIRAIAIGLGGDRTLTVRYYLDREPHAFDEESLEVVATNISASIGSKLVEHIEIDCQFKTAPLCDLDPLSGFIYCRREYDMPDELS
ncbi:colicin [Sinorhizobium psoraleae]|uniref:Colicin n=1 Tax=Sinorhizobium psoraleae TaxID=520838 RepID=A0ABT4KE67_9HYPH|nr:colicin [Sinorhizobium psoraleae]MCZ4090179.1 colicin [Sinorhizobium psoraleae]NRP71503.1 hypothetical protein [Sinorhizobium psoraleae]